MKRLTLVRHAKSSWKDPELADFDRPLNERGKKAAPLMGERLAARGQRPDILISSPARRARETATLLARELALEENQMVFDKGIYLAEPQGLLEVVRKLDDRWDQVLLVGHNPGLTGLGNLLADCGLDNIPTCGVLCLDFDAKTWKSLGPKAGTLVFYDDPKNRSEPAGNNQ